MWPTGTDARESHVEVSCQPRIRSLAETPLQNAAAVGFYFPSQDQLVQHIMHVTLTSVVLVLCGHNTGTSDAWQVRLVYHATFSLLVPLWVLPPFGSIHCMA